MGGSGRLEVDQEPGGFLIIEFTVISVRSFQLLTSLTYFKSSILPVPLISVPLML